MVDVVATTAVCASSVGRPTREGIGCVSAGDEFRRCDCRGFRDIFHRRKSLHMTGWCVALVLAM